ncbi:unnamed protein product [Discosporangium mesarthrocarpum]
MFRTGVMALLSIGALGVHHQERPREQIVKHTLPLDMPLTFHGAHNRSIETQEAQEQIDEWWASIEHASPVETVDLPNIVFIKPHKVGSSSMYYFLRTVAARYNGFQHEYFLVDSMENFFGAWKNQPVKSGLHLWSDHGRLNDLLQISTIQVLEQSFKLTLVREPVDRCFSAFYYYKCNADCHALPEEEMTQRKLDFKVCGSSSKSSTQMKEIAPAGENSTVEETMAFYDFIGITGRFMESLTVIKMVLGLRYGDMLYYDSKISGRHRDSFKHPPIAEEPPEVIEHMKTLVGPQDKELFTAADQKLSEIIVKLEPEFSIVHARMVESLTAARLACGRKEGQDRRLRIASACFTYGSCRLSCLNKFAGDHSLWDVPTPVKLDL